MCGLIGVAGAKCPDQVQAALEVIAHRGPDGRGVYADEAVTLGHNRLAILDPAHGHQPFETEDGRYILTFNGEIYNFKLLAQHLRRRGVVLRTNCDTETLAYWLREKGVDGLSALNGMFALAFWDKVDRRLILARDRFGMKPLYISPQSNRLIFASEIKAMLPWLDVKPNFDAIKEFLTFQNVIGKHSFFSGVEQVGPGEFIEWVPDQVRRGTYWRIEFPEPSSLSAKEASHRYRDQLESSVERHLISDVPLGSYLSGGIDSGSVAALAARQINAPLQTFTGAFTDGRYYDEREGAFAVAQSVNAQTHEIEITPEHYLENIVDVLWHLDEPTLGTGALPQYMVSQMVSDHVKVVLTGHGGDELYAGYQVNKSIFIRDNLARAPFSALGMLSSVRRDELTRVLYFLLFPLLVPEVRYGIFIMTSSKEWRRLAGPGLVETCEEYGPFESVRDLVDGHGYSAEQSLFVFYLRTYLRTLFTQEDKVGMAHSIEARMPICENGLLDFAMSLPLSTKLDGGRLKSIPKAAVSDVLPSAIYRLPKRGFPTPFARWYRCNPLRDFLAELLLSDRSRSRGLYSEKFISQLFKSCTETDSDTLWDYARANKLYALSMVELWFRIFIDGESPYKANL